MLLGRSIAEEKPLTIIRKAELNYYILIVPSILLVDSSACLPNLT